MHSYIRIAILKSIRIYQKTISPDHGVLFFFSARGGSALGGIFPISRYGIGACKFRPTCSQYCYKAIEKYGVIKGINKGIKRIIRCHPWSHGGWDPV